MKVIEFGDLELHIDDSNTLSTNEVALGYGVTPQAIRTQKLRHSDEILKNTHYIEVWDEKFKRYVTRWTLEGVHMLGFFIKSERAKEFRKFTAKLLTEIKKGNAQVIPTVHCPASDNLNARINGYRGMLARKQKEIDELRFQLAIYKDKVQEDFEKKIKALDLYSALTEHNLLDLVGAFKRVSLDLAQEASSLERTAKEKRIRAKHIDHLIDQIVKYYPKAKNIVELVEKKPRW